MMKKPLRGVLLKSTLALGAVGVIATASATLAHDLEPIDIGCDRTGECPAVYAPVKCDNGRIYSNACYAWLACATGCVPFDIIDDR